MSSGALEDVILGTGDDDASGSGVDAPGHFERIGADDIFSIGQGGAGEEANEGFVGVGGVVAIRQFVVEFPGGIAGGWGGWCEVERSQDAAVDGDQVGGELDGDGLIDGEAKLLFDFREVAVFGDAVGSEAFVALAVEVTEVGFTACAGDAAE